MQTLSKAGIRTGICFMPILPGLCDTPENLELVIKTTADNGGKFVLASALTLADQQKTYFLEVLRTDFPELYSRYLSLYPPGSYGPAGDAWLNVGRQIRQICRKAGIPDRQPRPLIPGEKRALNKRVAEFLADKTYSMELEGQPALKIWPYRKAAWAVEELEQDLGLVYGKMGLSGLKSVKNIGESIGIQIEKYILSCQPTAAGQ